MIIVIALLVYYVYLFIGFAKSYATYGWDTIGFLIVCLILGIVVALITGVIIAVLLGRLIPQKIHEEADDVFDIGALERGANTEGRFFLGIGAIKEEVFYFFYQRNDDGGYVPKRLSIAENITFYEDETEEDANIPAQMQIFTKSFVWEWAEYVFLPSPGNYYKFYIPKGSIKSEYKL